MMQPKAPEVLDPQTPRGMAQELLVFMTQSNIQIPVQSVDRFVELKGFLADIVNENLHVVSSAKKAS